MIDNFHSSIQVNKLNLKDFILIPPSGELAISRFPMSSIPAGARIATPHELLCAMRGSPFPWGYLPQPNPNNRHWLDKRVSVGGLIHHKWFLTTSGRFGGAANVIQTLPGSLRYCMYLDGGGNPENEPLMENEGYAVVYETTAEDRKMFREVQLHAARFVMADGGGIIVSPVTADGTIYTGFVGRCQTCPNPELISFNQLKTAVQEYKFELWPEWQNWSLKAPSNSDGAISQKELKARAA